MAQSRLLFSRACHKGEANAASPDGSLHQSQLRWACHLLVPHLSDMENYGGFQGYSPFQADNFDNLKFQDANKVAIFRPLNSYILHCHGKCGLFTLYLKGNGMKNSKFGKS